MNSAEFKAIRKELGLGQQQCANTLGIALSSVQAYERGTTPIRGIVANVLILTREVNELSQKTRDQEERISTLQNEVGVLRGELKRTRMQRDKYAHQINMAARQP